MSSEKSVPTWRSLFFHGTWCLSSGYDPWRFRAVCFLYAVPFFLQKVVSSIPCPGTCAIVSEGVQPRVPTSSKSNVGRQTQHVAWYQLGGFRTPVVRPPHRPVYLHPVLRHISSFSIRGRCYHNHGQSTFQVVAEVFNSPYTKIEREC